jgi:serine/threonine protein kinase
MLLGPVIRKPAANGIAGAVSTQPAPGASIKVQETGLIPRRPPAAQISTQALSLPGAIDYQAPEQLTSAVPSAKSDLYSLGASLYFLLAGRPPFAVDSSVDCMLQLQETPVRIDSLRKDVRPALGDLIHQLLAKEPAARPRSAASLAQYLQPYIDFNDGPARIRVASTSAKSARLTEIGMEEVEAPTIEPFSHGTHDSRVFGLGRASGDGEQEHHDMFASNADDNHAGPSRLRKKKKGRPTRRRWGMIIFAIALHVVAFGFLAIYLLKAGPFAESKPTYKKHVPAKTNQ